MRAFTRACIAGAGLVGAGPLQYTDNFNRANGGLGSNWQTAPTLAAPTISSNVVTTSASTEAGALWIGGTALNAAQYVQALIDPATSGGVGLLWRFSTGAFSGYQIECYDQQTTCELYEITSGSWTEIGSFSHGISAGVPFTLRVESNGGTHSVYVNGGFINSYSDSTHTAGRTGLYKWHNTGNVDDFVTGNL